ncbi:hypothetical protein QWZ13_16215 [Reinekea marina]|nr:hypothetical protein [Reinekea marina]MDN3650454.1 hypothetical protein [Reinekea marina]
MRLSNEDVGKVKPFFKLQVCSFKLEAGEKTIIAWLIVLSCGLRVS